MPKIEKTAFLELLDSPKLVSRKLRSLIFHFFSLIILGDTCAAKFLDGQWYRAKVLKVSGGEATVLYFDYGNRDTIPKAKCATLPSSFHGLPPFAKEYGVAFLTLAPDVSIFG